MPISQNIYYYPSTTRSIVCSGNSESGHMACLLVLDRVSFLHANGNVYVESCTDAGTVQTSVQTMSSFNTSRDHMRAAANGSTLPEARESESMHTDNRIAPEKNRNTA